MPQLTRFYGVYRVAEAKFSVHRHTFLNLTEIESWMDGITHYNKALIIKP